MNVLHLHSRCSWGINPSTGFLSCCSAPPKCSKGKEAERCLPRALAPFLVLAVRGKLLGSRVPSQGSLCWKGYHGQNTATSSSTGCAWSLIWRT